MQILDDNIRERWRNYTWQSIAAGFSIILITYLFTDIVNLILVAAIGSTAFVVFALPNTRPARPRSIVGGHLICALTGLACSQISTLWLGGGLAVGLSTFLMVITATEHPPSAGTALALAVNPVMKGAIFIVSAAVMFSIIRYLLSPWLKNLM